MSDRLAAYLNDHMAGARTAIGLLETLRDEHEGEPLQEVAAAMLVEVEADREELQRVIDHVGGEGGRLKAAAAWLGEKAAPLGARLGVDRQLRRLEMVEALTLGVLGKRALWRSLEAISATESRLPGIDFPRLIERAQAQHARLETQRIEAARDALVE